jgi:hypothetical protein
MVMAAIEKEVVEWVHSDDLYRLGTWAEWIPKVRW